MQKMKSATRHNLIEPLESRTLLAANFNLDVDFTKAGSTVFPGFTADTGAAYGSRGSAGTFGWSSDNTKNTRERNSSLAPNQAYDTVSYMQVDHVSRTWEAAVPNGTYTVRIVAGDANYAARRVGVTAEGTTVLQGTTTSAKRFIDGEVTVKVTDGRLTLGNNSAAKENVLAFVRITGVADGTTPPPASAAIPWPGKWTKAADAPTAVFESHDAVVGNKLYVFGGWIGSHFTASKKVMVYDPATNDWATRKDMPAPETHAAFATDTTTNLIYSAGGNRGDIPETVVADVYRYNPATDVWTKLVSLPQPIGGGTAQVIDNKLHVIGGFESDNDTATTVHYVLDLADPAAGWTTAASLPTVRDHLASVVIDGKLYAVGGEIEHRTGFQHQKRLDVYDPATDRWTRLADAPTGKSHAEGSTFVVNGKIIYAGGQTYPQEPTNEVVQYDPKTNRWTTLAPLPAARQGVAVARVGNYFVITTGGVATTQPQKTTWVSKIVT